METTETNPKIKFIKALQKAQKEFPSLGKSKHVNQGAFGYDYLPLEQMLSLLQPVLHKNNFHLSQIFGYTPTGQTLIKTKLVHADGHEEISELPLFLPPRDLQKKNEAHVWGGSVTYQRRYSIKLILGLETDMDNNMEIEEEKPKKGQKFSNTAPSPTSGIYELAFKWIQKATTQKQLDQVKERLESNLKEGKISQNDKFKLTNAIVQKEASLL
tara:strand:- start:1076 stop:1717 length:642 start_codon:yes stop_codon:yes gene_type:complete